MPHEGPTTGADRVRALRARRRRGIRQVVLRIDPVEVELLVKGRYLDPAERTVQKALQAAAEAFFSDRLAGYTG